uniref:Uncharacterized protein n=1 Tax=Amorphochlora amoebiformis TaxID=1561963 RepID=A0A7S0DSK0_9EUKA|mmetsp:Transcript_73/g.93  ORF Transcript_73/g.93 Transcript_73/m.93 type:complete len:108 (+) Transcript_73:971-1294(+)
MPLMDRHPYPSRLVWMTRNNKQDQVYPTSRPLRSGRVVEDGDGREAVGHHVLPNAQRVDVEVLVEAAGFGIPPSHLQTFLTKRNLQCKEITELENSITSFARLGIVV